jgi:DNA-binding NarL/FixJ family response regulator
MFNFIFMSDLIRVTLAIERPSLLHFSATLLKFENVKIVQEVLNHNEIENSLLDQPSDVIVIFKEGYLDKLNSIELVKRNFPNTKVIVISPCDSEMYLIHLMEKGINGFVLERNVAEELGKAIISLSTSKFYLNKAFLNAMAKKFDGSEEVKETYPFIELTEMQLKIISLICKEYSSKEIAEELSLSSRTVENHRDRMIKKVGAKNMVGLVMYAVKYRLV